MDGWMERNWKRMDRDADSDEAPLQTTFGRLMIKLADMSNELGGLASRQR